MKNVGHWHGHQRGHGSGRGYGYYGCGPGGRRFDREAWLRYLEEYQKDLEQEVADVAELIRRLKEKLPDEQPTETASV
ncbi:MAG: hypothetical protein ACRDH6_02800 [Actinomycetota bacterium]